ncbi:hypothetical protein ACFQ0D_18660 [Micromonospora zhanjiangensis]
MAVPVVTNQSDADPDPGADEPGTRGRFRPPPRADLLAIGAYVLLGVFVCANYWVDVQHRVSSHLPTDHSWFEWLFAHGAYSVRHLENPLFTLRQNVPNGVNMIANTSLLGVTLPMAPITMLFGPQVSYTLYLGAALAATAGTSYWVLSRYLVRSRGAAFVGGAFLGFAPGIIHHANGQPNFASNFLLPLIVARVTRLGLPDRRWWRDGVVLGLLVTYQIFINEEMLLLTALACLVLVLAYAVQRWSDAVARSRRFLLSLGVGGALTGVLAAYPIWFQFDGPQSYRGLQGGVFHNWGEDLAAFVTFARDTVAGSPEVEKTIGLTEQNTWFGWPLVILVLLVAVLLWRVSLAARIATVLAVVFTLAALGPQVRLNAEDTGAHGVWHYLSDDLPLVEMMMPTRLSLIVVGAVGVLVALAWEQARLRAETRPALRFPAYALIALALVPLFPRPLPAEHVDLPPHFIMSGGWRPYVPAGRTLVPVPTPSNVHGLPTLRWSALTLQEFPVPGGYFIGPSPTGEGIFGAAPRPTSGLVYAAMDKNQVPRITDENRRQAVEDLRYWRASVVVLGAHPQEALLRDTVTGLLGQPQRVDDVWLWDVRSLVS